MVSEVKKTEKEVNCMHTYRYIIIDDEEYYEVWD